MMSSPRLIAVAVMIAGLYTLGFLLNRWLGIGGKRRSIKRKRLLTPTEVRFWRVLVAAVPDYAVSSQVAMGAMLKPIGGLSRSEMMSSRGRFAQKIVDFLVVDPQTADVVAVVELDARALRARLFGVGGSSDVTAIGQSRAAL